MNLETGNKGSGQMFPMLQKASHNAINAPSDPVLPKRKLVPASGVISALMLLIKTLLTWAVVVITLFILFITWLVTIREKKDFTDKNRRKNLLLIISE